MPSRVLTLLTDFGDADGFVGIMKGVVLAIAPAVRIVDLSHQVPPQQLVPAALILRSALPFFPAGTIHVVVVDPGVGTDRRAIAVETGTGVLVGPDNGVLFPAAAAVGWQRAFAIESPAAILAKRSQTFHGRDIFAPAAAHLAAGAAIEALGPRIDELTPLAIPSPAESADGIKAEVIYVDRFGNLVTNASGQALAGFRHLDLSVSIAGMKVAGPVPSYAAVAEGELLAVINSWDMLEIAVRNGSAAAHLNVGVGAMVTIRPVGS